MPLPITDLARSIAAVFDRCDLRPAPPVFKDIRAVGRYGEKVAARFLTRRYGYRVLVRNYSTERGEIDLICRAGDVLAFVEVRTRYYDTFGLPVESIDETKRRHLKLAAHSYLRELRLETVD